MENELTRIDEEEIEEENLESEEDAKSSGIGTGWAMLIGSGLTLTAIAVGKKAKKAWRSYKAKKEQERAWEKEILGQAHEIIDNDERSESDKEPEENAG